MARSIGSDSRSRPSWNALLKTPRSSRLHHWTVVCERSASERISQAAGETRASHRERDASSPERASNDSARRSMVRPPLIPASGSVRSRLWEMARASAGQGRLGGAGFSCDGAGGSDGKSVFSHCVYCGCGLGCPCGRTPAPTHPSKFPRLGVEGRRARPAPRVARLRLSDLAKKSNARELAAGSSLADKGLDRSNESSAIVSSESSCPPMSKPRSKSASWYSPPSCQSMASPATRRARRPSKLLERAWTLPARVALVGPPLMPPQDQYQGPPPGATPA